MLSTSSRQSMGCAAALLFTVSATMLHAQSTWDGQAGDLLWNSPTNWNPDGVPVSGANTSFSGNVGTVLLNVDATIGTFSATVATGETVALNTTLAPRTFTINSGITTVGAAGTLTLNAGTSPNFLTLALGANNAWNIGRSISVNAVVTDGLSSFGITKTGAGALTLAGNNTFDGGITLRQATINMTGAAANTVLGNGPFTFGNLEGSTGAPTLFPNAGVSKTFTNNFVNDNAENNDNGQVAQISTAGGSSGYRTLTFNTGTFSTGANYNNNQGLNLVASTGSTGLSEGAYFFNGNWSGYLGVNANTAIRIGAGSVVLGASAIAGNGGYSINGNDAIMGAKLILATTSTTMPNRVEIAGLANGMRGSFGARHASGTSTQSGVLSIADTDGGNVFSQSNGATLALTGVISGSQALRINDRYTFTSADAVNSLETPTGTVAITNGAANTNSGGITVVNGTLLINGDAGFTGTGSGTVTVGTVGAAVSAQGGVAAVNSRVITGVTTATAQTLQIGQSITGTNIPGSSVITGITIGATTSTIVINNTITTATPDVQFATTAFTSNATLGGTGRIAPTVPNGVLVRGGSSVSLVDGITEDLLIRFVAAGSPQPAGTAVFSTGSTFGFELAAPGTSDLIDFTGLATANAGGSVAFNSNVVNFTGLSGVAAGEYTLFTFDAPGKYTGTLAAGTLPAGISGATFAYNASDIKVTLTAGTPYTTWAGGAAFDADANNDGVKNGLAWMLGAGSPNVSALGLLPTATASGGNLTLSTFNRVDPKGPAKLFVEYSNNLSTWTPTETPTVNGVYPTGNITITVAGSPPTQTVAVTVSSPAAAGGGKLFARLRATED